MDPDIKKALIENGLPLEFSKSALGEADRIPSKVKAEDFENRRDLRSLNFVTIDGQAAKDFDDAVFVRKKNKCFSLWVAIADVSHYVKQKTFLDKEAFERGTSVYLPNYVLPMLPEPLSNGICSLKPNEDRLAFVCEMDIGFDGCIHKSQLYEAVICSRVRLTYNKVQEIINHHFFQKKKNIEPMEKGVLDSLLQACHLAKILMNKRHREGSLDLDIPEVQVIVDDLGKPLRIEKNQRLFSHRLIEEFMLSANVSVARMIETKKQNCLFRVHSPPDRENIESLQKFLFQFGSKKKLKGGHLQKKINKCLKGFKSGPQATVMGFLILRSMNQALYDKNNIGHFGLAFSHYTHFTSPIRRYPDLVVHRILKKLFTSSSSGVLYSEESLTNFGTLLSAREQRSVKTERQVLAIKKARFLENHLGERFSGVISQVTRFGVFVLLDFFDIDGLVKVENLGGEFFGFDRENLILTGKKTKKTYKIGDLLNIIVSSVNTDDGKIGFLLSDREGRPVFRNSQRKRRGRGRGFSKKQSGKIFKGRNK